jgi:hypothetical protein
MPFLSCICEIYKFIIHLGWAISIRTGCKDFVLWGQSQRSDSDEVGDGTGKKILSSVIFWVNGLELRYFLCTNDLCSIHVENHCWINQRSPVASFSRMTLYFIMWTLHTTDWFIGWYGVSCWIKEYRGGRGKVSMILAPLPPPPQKGGGGSHDCVDACWFQCYHLLHSNVILEMFWRQYNGLWPYDNLPTPPKNIV